MDLLTAQLYQRGARILRAHAELTTGAYLLDRAGNRRTVTDGAGRPLTDAELLADKVAEMNRHAELLDDIVDAIGESPRR